MMRLPQPVYPSQAYTPVWPLLLNRLNDERSRYFVELTAPKVAHEIKLNALFLVFVTHDATSFEIAPEDKSIFQRVATDGLYVELLLLSSCFRFCLSKPHVGEVTESYINDSAVDCDSYKPRL